MTDEAKHIILEPNYAMLRTRFAAEAKHQADTILADLLPEELIEPEHVKAIQLAVLRTFQSVLVPVNICIQAADCNQAVLDCRELVDGVCKMIIAKGDEIEQAIEQENDAEPIRCGQCEALMINGVFCHEHGCPNSKKTYEDGEWVLYLECHECGSKVREGESCCEWPELTTEA